MSKQPDELHSLIKTHNALISLVSTDEVFERQTISSLAQDLDRNLIDWSVTQGIRVHSPLTPDAAAVSDTEKPELALEYLLRQKRPYLSCFRGLASYTKQPRVQRLLQDYIIEADSSQMSLILMDEETLSPRVRRLAVPWHPGLPNTDKLGELVRTTYKRLKRELDVDLNTNIRRSEFQQLVLNLRGLTRSQAVRIVESVLLHDQQLTATDLQRVIEAKRRLLEGTGSLESMTIDFNISEVGGLRGLKQWLKKRRDGFSEKARAFGIEPPRGVLMLGVPGCGKSLCAKAVAADWQMPLLRLDPGVLYQKFIGESENELRQAILQAEAMAPVILWIDEIEKAFASASSSSSDGGLSQRMFGTLLSWMQDHREPIFMVATANDISALPPELMRKGRFDEVFFIDLPPTDARRQIFSIHLQRRNRDPADFDLDQLADSSKDLTGSEIEHAIISGLFHAFSEDRQVTTEDVLKAIAETHPLSSLMAEKIDQLRSWAKNRCVLAD
ncbi:MAG: AAA family ATPase [Fuerstiella sp.]|nr:AAA family ATPase [Fuerstiella sp.]